ncbi:hypothetical protein [Photobacterium iliopiscarium]|uniref:hypothetical protein n=1 Tax=Photobacterium iliopiscarium TaxID=56192 RepID=UPI001E3BFAFD|nr:hypothetical protein [Photobacterium iliopiscarium]MCD9468802.1 hypothetical protein [Photobacterium iliopiscarium]MCD9488919.1 hypothetical protein [Photobacterium iliopiscarium]MCF2245646.1 hypothetical protein [Photobacterium iliopiscarium]
MNKYQQSGMTTLLITSMLLIVALLFSLASYKNLFYQIKRTQNEVLARQAHWIAEGGLECGFVELKHEKIKPTESAFSQQCIELVPFSVSALTIIPDPPIGDHSKYELKSSYTHAGVKQSVKKIIEYGGGGVVSTLQTSASIQLTGSQHFVPNQTDKKNLINEYECLSIISGGDVDFISTSNGTDEHFLTADATLDSHAGNGNVAFKCQSTHMSNFFDVGNRPVKYSASLMPYKGKDIAEHKKVNVFKDIFGKDISESGSVRDEIKNDPLGIVIAGDTTEGGWIKQCNTKVGDAYKNGKRRIWIDGHCALSGPVFGVGINQIDSNVMQVVIYDGVLYLQGAGYLNGLLYQYVSDSVDVENTWRTLLTENLSIGVTPLFTDDHITSLGYTNMPSLIEGPFILDGGIGIDAKDRDIKINGSFVPSYNEGKVTKYSTQIKWQQGSWHDF